MEMPFKPYFDAVAAALDAVNTETRADAEARLAADEEFTAECMKEAGFVYYPNVYQPDPGDAPDGTDPSLFLPIPVLPDTLEETRVTGYGVSLSPLEQEEPPAEAEQKNTDYRDGLSAEGRRAYDLALVGHFDEVSAEKPVESCRSRAEEAFPAPPDTVDLYFMKDPLTGLRSVAGRTFTLGADGGIEEVFEPDSMYLRQDMKDLDAEYTACVQERHSGTWDASEATNPMSMEGTAVRTAPDGSLFDYGGRGLMLAEELPPESSSLTGSQIEIDIAVVDFQCRVETDYVARFAQIQYDAEAAYVEAHKAELDQMMASLEAVIEQAR
jgi:hypothetical protein